MYPDELRYDETHQWARKEGDIAVIGITDFAQNQLGEVTFVDLPQLNAEVTAGQMIGTVESTKSISDVYTPISGTVVAVNEALDEDPLAINRDPYNTGWIAKIAMSQPDEYDKLLTAAEYQAHM